MASNGEGTEKLIHSYGSIDNEREPPLYNGGLGDDKGTRYTLNTASLAFIGVSYFVPEGWNCFPGRGNERKVKKILNSTRYVLRTCVCTMTLNDLFTPRLPKLHKKQ